MSKLEQIQNGDRDYDPKDAGEEPVKKDPEMYFKEQEQDDSWLEAAHKSNIW